MRKDKTKLEFILGNEIMRLENADSFDLYILKSKIEKCLTARKIAEHVRNNVGAHMKYVYYDSQSGHEEIIKTPILVSDIGGFENVLGMRQRDEKEISIDLEAVDLSRSCPYDENISIDDREEMKESWKCPYRTRIAYEQFVHLGNQKHAKCFVLGYLAKWSQRTIRLMLLSGEPVILQNQWYVDSHIYHPTESEHAIFDKFENDKMHQEKIKERINMEICDFIRAKKESDTYDNVIKKLRRRMMTLGYDIPVVNEQISRIYPEPRPCSDEEIQKKENAIDNTLDHMLRRFEHA